jgi:mono/diheme cytochrome c family protein
MRFITRFRLCARRLFWTLVAMPCLPLLGLCGQTSSESKTSAKVMQVSSESAAAGVALFNKMRCARCHDAQGKGTAARDDMPEIPDFTSAHWQKKRPVAQLVAAILDGRGTKMPAFAGRVTREEAHELALYVRTMGPVKADVDGPAVDFQKRFDELQKEFQRLREQFEELNRTAKKHR